MRHLREVIHVVTTPANDRSVITTARGHNLSNITIQVQRFSPGAKIADYDKQLSMDDSEARTLYWALHQLLGFHDV